MQIDVRLESTAPTESILTANHTTHGTHGIHATHYLRHLYYRERMGTVGTVGTVETVETAFGDCRARNRRLYDKIIITTGSTGCTACANEYQQLSNKSIDSTLLSCKMSTSTAHKGG